MERTALGRVSDFMWCEMDDGLAVLRQAANAVSEEMDCDIYIYSGAIDDSGFGQLVEAVSAAKSRPNALLMLTTNGGSANSGYQIARLFQHSYDKFVVCVPAVCKSAGTLVALGAHALIMQPVVAELGPLDVQLFRQNEILGRKSGLLNRSSFEALAAESFLLYETMMLQITMKSGGNIGFKLASELSSLMTSNFMAPIFGQMNPEVIGGEHRDLNVALEYGLRLAELSENCDPSTVAHLVRGYPSHDFIIDSDEAKALFHHVWEPSDSLYVVIGSMSEEFLSEQNPTLVGTLSPLKDQEEKEHGDIDQSEQMDADRSAVGEGDSEPAGAGEPIGSPSDATASSHDHPAPLPSSVSQGDQSGGPELKIVASGDKAS